MIQLFTWLLLTTLYMGDKQSCDCPRMTVKEKAQQAEIIFTGKVVRLDSMLVVPEEMDLLYNSNADSLKTRLSYNYFINIDIETVYKGKEKYLPQRATIFAGERSDNCSYNFSVGERYLVYTSFRPIIFLREINRQWVISRGGVFATNTCDGTTPNTAADEKALKKLFP